ncbi:hypothetical protein GYMLUDRAFT_46871 [Collybiopsis luxurians FD-317 M1]|uniref:Uncharacterized protein n=1 Tax=Collybiopsis luxurians FD-317 M1 TaxID=944289 RepID=A0A0D0B0Y1_9AGAR|nr:hypothetical protein GYMLUDRAFT_46871 [Collybiopsis luxurians FD-317 M1]
MQNSQCCFDLNPIAYRPSNLNETFKDLAKDVWIVFGTSHSTPLLNLSPGRPTNMPNMLLLSNGVPARPCHVHPAQ